MAFLLTRSTVLGFLLTNLLLTYSSFANDKLPQVRERDRKLLNVLQPISKGVSGFGKFFDEHLNRVTEVPTETVIGESNKPLNHVTGPVEPLQYETKLAARVNRRKLEKFCKVQANAVKRMGETAAGKLFSKNGRKVFRAGWNAGKLYLKLEKKCQEYQNENICVNSPPCVRMNCIVEVVGATGEMSCPDDCSVLPDQFPCSHHDIVALGISNNEMP